MPLNRTIVLDLTSTRTDALATAGVAISAVKMCLRGHQRVIAVVAPDPDQEARATDESARLGATSDPTERAQIAVCTALESADRFARVLRETGLDAAVGDDSVLPATRGHPLDAEPRRVSARALSAALAEIEVLVIPGGVGLDDEGNRTSLGEGTGRLSALFIADRLGLGVRVPAHADFARSPESLGARKADRIARLGGIEPEALTLDADSSDLSETTSPRVALLGGSEPGALLSTWLDSIAPNRARTTYQATEQGRAALISDRPDVVLDLTEDADASYSIASWALRTGRSFITANASLLAERGGGLGVSALIGRGELRASGAVVGCPQLARLLGRVSDWPGVRRVQGTFSPAGDRILDLRASGIPTEQAERIVADELGLDSDAIRAAQRGDDAFRTLAAVAPLAFGAPAGVRTRPRGPEHVSDIDLARASAQGRRYRVIATTERLGDEISVRVGPVPVRADDPLIRDEPGAIEVIVETRTGESLRASGRLHHPGSVAGALLNDLIELLHGRLAPSPAERAATPQGSGVLGVTA